MAKILIEHATVLSVDENNTIHDPGFIYVDGDHIAAVGPDAGSDALVGEAEQIIDASNMLIMPGMINAHVHLFQSFVRGLADDRPLLRWLKEIVWPVFAHMTAQDVYYAAMISLIENVRGGATAMIDNHYVHIDPDSDDAVCRAAEQMGIRYKLARGWADENYHPSLQETPQRILAELERLFREWHGQAEGRISVECGPLIPWGCSDETMLKTYALAQAWDAGLQMHVSETQDEVQMSLHAVGMRPIEWLAGLGLLGPHMQLVHSVWLSEREMELIAESASVVVHCPVSNMFLASGVSPIADLWARGVPVALATDGQACNNGQEMIEMPRAALNLQKVATLDATVLKPADVLHMASRGGAAAFGQRATLGSLEPGKKADLTLVSLVDTRFLPGMERQSALVNFAAKQDVDSVMVDGEFVMRAGQILTLEVESILEEARRARIDLLRRAGIETH